MKEERQTKENLLLEAKEEFLEKGYMKASLRNICKKAGVTTGALYFFFKDKEDLFGTIVKEPLEKLYKTMKEHYDMELNDINNTIEMNRDFSEDMKASMIILDYMYQYKEEFLLVLTKAQGSKYENRLEEIIKMNEKHYRLLADRIALKYKKERLDDYTIRWITQILIFSFTEPIIHGINKEEAIKQLNIRMKFIIGGWIGLYSE